MSPSGFLIRSARDSIQDSQIPASRRDVATWGSVLHVAVSLRDAEVHSKFRVSERLASAVLADRVCPRTRRAFPDFYPRAKHFAGKVLERPAEPRSQPVAGAVSPAGRSSAPNGS